MTALLTLEVLQFIVKTVAGRYGNSTAVDAEATRLLNLIEAERKALHDGLAANRDAAAAIIAEREKAARGG